MSPIYLLDTNVISEFSKPRPNQTLIQNVKEREDLCAICSVVWQESVFGYERMPVGRNKQYIADWLQDIKSSYDILPYDSFAASICSRIRSKCEKQGKTLPYSDSQIAATAIANGMVLITHNVDDYKAFQENTMLKVEDWWG